MSRKVLDYTVGESEADIIMNNIIAQNPQLNAQIEKVHNESNVFLCKILRIYSYDDKAFVKIINTNKNVFCRLSHEIMGREMSIDYLPKGVEKKDDKFYKGRSYIEPYDDLYGILIKVRWNNLDDENVLIGYVNVYDKYNLKSSSDDGELSIKSGSSIISVDDERINIMTPSLFINGLPYSEPELNNYYDKNESDVIFNALDEKINNIDTSGGGGTPSGDLSEYVKKSDVSFNVSLEDNGTMIFELNVGDSE